MNRRISGRWATVSFNKEEKDVRLHTEPASTLPARANSSGVVPRFAMILSAKRIPALLAVLVLLLSPLTAAAQDASVAEDENLPTLELGLFEAIEMALRYNLQVKISAYAPDLQEESITSARARFDPTIRVDVPSAYRSNTSQGTSTLAGADVLTSENVSAGFSFNDTLEYGTNWSIAWTASRNTTNNTFSTFNPNYGSTLNLTVNQPLLRNFGKEVNTQQIVVAQNNYAISQEQFRSQVQQIIFQVYQAYWELGFAERDLEVKEEALRLAQQQLDRNRIQVEIGTLAPIETIQAEQQVANRELALIQAQVAVRDREDDLKRFLNIEAAVDEGWRVNVVPSAEPAVDTDPIDVEAAIQEALDNDPTLRQRRIELDTRQLNVDVSRNQLLPQVNFSGSIQLSGQGGDLIFRQGGGFGSAGVLEVQQGGFNDAVQAMASGDFRNWSVGLSVQFPLNNWAAKAQYAQATISQQNTLTQIADLEQQIRVEVTKAARQVQSGMQQVSQSRTALTLAERQLDAEQRKFAVGTTTNFQVLEFQRQLADAATAELRSVINFTNSLARLELAKGTLLEALGVNVGMAGVPGRAGSATR
jgi:outer membrane protein TolC